MKFQIWHTYKTNSQNLPTKQNDQIIPIIMNHSSIGRGLVQKYKEVIKQSGAFNAHRLIWAFCIGKNLRQILVRSKFATEEYKASMQSTGKFHKCKSARCITCRVHTSESNTIRSTANKQIFPILETLTCTTTSVIYVITCTKCNIQYVGETGNNVRDRLTQHRSNIKHKKQTPISIHFNATPHEPKHITIIPIQTKINHSERLKCEKLWMKKLGTIYPGGLNSLPIFKITEL